MTGFGWQSYQADSSGKWKGYGNIDPDQEKLTPLSKEEWEMMGALVLGHSEIEKELFAEQGCVDQIIPISNLPDGLDIVCTFQRKPANPPSKKEIFNQIRQHPVLWDQATKIASKIPFNKWISFSAHLPPDVMIFWANVLRFVHPDKFPGNVTLSEEA